MISIHAPPRGATSISVEIAWSRLFQFTPLREGRLSFFSSPKTSLYISIHAPPRGATKHLCGALCAGLYFNSRPSARGDIRGCVYRGIELFQFTPLREGRPFYAMQIMLGNKFQFTPLREGRHSSIVGMKCWSPFQFTPLREGRQVLAVLVCTNSHFNSRPSARGDANLNAFALEKGIFQFTPLREGRLSLSPLRLADVYFNSRPSARGDDKSEAERIAW